MTGATFDGELAMDRLRVGGDLVMRDHAKFAAVRLVGAHIEGQVVMDGSTFTGELAMDRLKVGGNLVMGSEKDQPAAFTSVRLLGARVEGQLSMNGSTFTGDVRMDGLEVEGELFLDGTVFSQPVAMPVLHVGRLLSLDGTGFGSLRLTRARIDGTFRIAVAGAAREGRLDLTGATTGAIEDSRDGWPLHLRLDGFTYTHWDALNSREGSPMAARDADWFIDWLGRQTDFSPRPYEQLAKVLRETGHADKAKDVLYEARERERREEQKNRTWWRNGRWWWLTFKWTFIGHGHRVQWSLWWALGFVVLGAGVFWTTPAACAMNVLEMLAYSADMLLPIIELNKAHEAIVVCGWQLGYFYFHKVMGFVLASFLVAGLSGLAK
jgi:cytoskeletal protein CcmA (bactofilin family)